jgi:hypothetical protein
MAFILNVKNSQSEFENTGYLFQGTWYVDDQFQEGPGFIGGLEVGSFCSIKSGNSKCLNRAHGTSQSTLFPASAKKVTVDVAEGNTVTVGPDKASGIIYKQSARDRYGRIDDFNDSTRLHPYGKREDIAIGLLREGVIEVSSTNSQKHIHWPTTDKTGPSVSIADATDLITGLTGADVKELGLKYGSKITINDEIFYVIFADESTGEVKVSKPVSGAKSGTIVNKCQMDDPLYLNIFTDAKSIREGGSIVHGYSSPSELPFTTIPPVMNAEYTAGCINQIVGYIESPIAARIDLNIDIDPAII